jgi:hypothetical protein
MAAWSRRARLNRLSDRLRRDPAQQAASAVVDTPCSQCGEVCGNQTIYQGGLTFRSDACARADLAYLETSR